MFEEQEELEIDEDEVTPEDELLYSSFTGLRLFVLDDLDKTNIWGVLLEESDDSFLVGLPARMISEEEGVVVVPFVPVPYLRFLKSAIMSVSHMFEPFSELYENYLNTKGRELYPEISEYIEEGEEIETEPAEMTVISSLDSDMGLAKDAPEGNQVLGMTDEELRQYLNDKHNNGELVIGSRKKQ